MRCPVVSSMVHFLTCTLDGSSKRLTCWCGAGLLISVTCAASLYALFRVLFPGRRTGRVWPRPVSLLVCAWLLVHGVSAAKRRTYFRQAGYNPWAEGAPDPRSSHTMATASDGSVYVFGGIFTTEPANDDLFKLDVDTGEWTLVEPLGTQRPSARYDHAMAAVGTDIYLFGGVEGSTSPHKGCDWWMGRGQTEGRACMHLHVI